MFIFKDCKLTYNVIFNNIVTKFNQACKIYKKHQYVECFWTDKDSKAGLGHPQYLLKKLENSNNRHHMELSQLVIKQ